VNIPWNLGKNQQIYTEIFGTYPGIVPRKWNFMKKIRIFLFLNSYKSFKTEYIYKNQLWTICTYIGLWFEVLKKMGSSKDHFLDFRVFLPGSQKYFREYLCENKNIFKTILGYCSRVQVMSIYAKNQSSKISWYSPFKRTFLWKIKWILPSLRPIITRHKFNLFY